MSITMIPKVIFLMGPTASGKTLLSIKLREVLPVELISVDSALIYKGLDISTAKPNTDELRSAPIRLIDIIDPSQTYSVANFYRDVLVHMHDIIAAGRIPLLVGGTMLYFKILLKGLSSLPSADYEIRAKIKQQAIEQSWSVLHKQLRSIDPVSAARIHPNDVQRLSRALEVFFISGKTLTELTKTPAKTLPYHVYQFAIAPESRELLYMRIEQRFHQMLAAGFEAEIQTLFNRGDLHADMPSIRCIGCRQMWAYLGGEISYDEMIYQGICATKQLAKRQMTWLRSWDNIHWLNSEKPQQALNKIQHVVYDIANCDIYNYIVLCLLFLVL